MNYDIIVENEYLIYSIINKYIYCFDKEDLYQVGVIGLINAYKNYKDDQNTKFSSYAYFYILGEVKKYIRDSNTFKISREITKLNISIEKARSILSQKLFREPSDFELSLFLEVDEKDIENAKVASSLVTSLDSDEEISLYNFIKVEDDSYNSEMLDLKFEINKLDNFSRNLINERYVNERSQMETSNVLGISQVQVSRKEKEILTRLRTKLK